MIDDISKTKENLIPKKDTRLTAISKFGERVCLNAFHIQILPFIRLWKMLRRKQEFETIVIFEIVLALSLIALGFATIGIPGIFVPVLGVGLLMGLLSKKLIYPPSDSEPEMDSK